MRDEDPEADQEVQYIQMKRKEQLRKACLKQYDNNYEHCTLQQKQYKHIARKVKQ